MERIWLWTTGQNLLKAREVNPSANLYGLIGPNSQKIIEKND